MPPGVKRTYVFVGPEMTERTIMQGLVRGRCFCTTAPGAMLLLTVNGAMIGDAVAPEKDGRLSVTVECKAARPIRKVELITDGAIARAWSGEGSSRLVVTTRLAATMRWLLAQAFVHEEARIETEHNPEPLWATGCVAFTNPVWVERVKH